MKVEKKTNEKTVESWAPLNSNRRVKKNPKDDVLKGGCDPCGAGTG